MAEIAGEIRRIRSESGLSLVAFGKRLGVSGSYISQVETAHRKSISYELAAKICLEFKLKPDHFMPFLAPSVATAPEDQLTRPIAGTVSAGKGIDRAAERGETLPIPHRMRHADALYRVRGTSMVAAGIDDGDVIGVRDAQDADHGEIVVAWLADRGVCVVKMIERWVDGMALLRGVNGEPQPPYQMIEGDEIVGVYVGKLDRPEKPKPKAAPKRKPKK